MSPNAYLRWNDETRLLEGFQGEDLNESPTFIWTYSAFEDYIGDAVMTPSMYHFMAGYVDNHMSKQELYEIQGGDYCPGDVEEDAVNAYFEISLEDRIEMHNQELANLIAEKEVAAAKEMAFNDAGCPFDTSNPIYIEYSKWVHEGILKWTHIREQLENAILEEEQWSQDF